MKYFQKEITLPAHSRGFHLITSAITTALPDITEISIGIMNVFVKHTSASLTINENADPTVREDFESHMNVLVPETANYFKHTLEGPDDMTSHIKSSLMGSELNIPITNGRLNMGIWQGIYLCEHRNYGGQRNIVITAHGR